MISVTISTLLGIEVHSYSILNIVVMNTFIHMIAPYFVFPTGELMGKRIRTLKYSANYSMDE